MDNLGEMIRRARLEQGFSLRQVGQALGLTTSTIASIEQGVNNLNSRHILTLVEFLDLDLKELTDATLAYPSAAKRKNLVKVCKCCRSVGAEELEIVDNLCKDCREGSEPTPELSNRPCKLCKKPLSMRRYFNCEECQPDLGEETEYYNIGGV